MSIITNMVTIVVAVITTTKITGQNKLASLICGLHTSHRIYLSDSLQNKLASLICGLHTSHRIYLSDSLQNKLASLICGLHTSHRIYLSDSLVRTFNFVESHTSYVRFIFRFTIQNGIRLILSDTVFLFLSLKILQKELPTPFQLVQKVSLLLQGQLLLQLDLI